MLHVHDDGFYKLKSGPLSSKPLKFFERSVRGNIDRSEWGIFCWTKTTVRVWLRLFVSFYLSFEKKNMMKRFLGLKILGITFVFVIAETRRCHVAHRTHVNNLWQGALRGAVSFVRLWSSWGTIFYTFFTFI